ncbi:dihydrofolate reductase family protein [Glutamicibacter sp.]|uniref:dihydrofolate reductase family protein n=1 Tax=Glutamicibacter sp. TaxID=1931995 RepID=UPI0028BDDF52|nr:dihydrofolate reductase family protein [Glutamicibacter sp.]
MRRLVYCVASTLDGFIAGPDGGDPTGPDGFWPVSADYLQYLVATYPEILPTGARTALGVEAAGTHFDTVLEGSRSYRIGLEVGVVDAFEHLRHIVFSNSLPASEQVEIVDADPLETVRKLKADEGKDLWLVGGSSIAGTLYPEIDSLILKLAPLTIGSGIPLFGKEFEPTSWTLRDTHQTESGALFLTYDRQPSQ